MTLSTNEMLDLPWKLFSRDDRKIVDCHGNTIIAEPDDNDLPDFVDLYAAQAALIVRAVNAHEALVAMVEALMGALRDEDDSFDVKYDARKLLESLE